jgi:oxygen-dependent protoporphyrinogen oxidase
MPYLKKSIAVLGGGVTGLAAAYRLTKLGHRVRLLESGSRLGGAIRTETTDGWLVETGPNSMKEDLPVVGELIHELSLVHERVEAAPASATRYVALGGRLVPMPASLPGVLFSSVLSIGGRLRFLAELGTRRRSRPGDPSVAEFGRDHFGRQAVDRMIQPFVSGLWAGDAERLSAQSAFPRFWAMERTNGSILRGQAAAVRARLEHDGIGSPRIISFKRGLQTLPWALTGRLAEGTVVLGARIETLVRTDRWQVTWTRHDEVHRDDFDAVIAPLPAGSLAALQIGGPGLCPLGGLAAIEHPALATVFLGYRREQVAHPLDGYGVLMPAGDRGTILGIIFSSTLFPGRAPAGCVGLTILAGGSLHPEAAHRPVDELVAGIRAELAGLLGVKGDPAFMRHSFRADTLPQYNVGHQRHRETINACERANPGLLVGGQVVDGVTVSECVAAGCSLADRADRIA